MQLASDIDTGDRRRGHATWALGAALDRARRLGLERVLLTCDDDNLASARVIEANGGLLSDTSHRGREPVRRYWIELG